jgi:hypothetical protein
MRRVSDVLKELEEHADAVVRLEAEANKHRAESHKLIEKT